MATYDNDLRLKEIATGDESGTWGTSTNTNLELIAEAFSYGTEAITTNADTHTTTIADGLTDPGRSMYLKYTGTLDSACTITIAPNDISKVWIIENGTSGSQNIILSQGSGANITIPAGDTKVVYSDGAGSGAAFVDAFASLNVGALTATTVNDIASKAFGTGSIMIGDTTTGTIDAANNNVGLGVDVFAALTSGDTNVAIGKSSLTANTTGSSNTAVGYVAMAANISGYNNVAIGQGALDADTAGRGSVAVGVGALSSQNFTTGQETNNTAVGFLALTANTTGTGNTAVGATASDAMTTGTYSTALGFAALSAATTPNFNVAIGASALQYTTTGYQNTALGTSALAANTTGADNVAVGFAALDAATTASNNVAVGGNALGANTTGNESVAIGSGALASGTSAHNNVAIGYLAANALATSAVYQTRNNVAIGHGALKTQVTQEDNIAIGYNALALGNSASNSQITAIGSQTASAAHVAYGGVYVGYQAGEQITSGVHNTLLGRQAGDNITTGTLNICLGYAAVPSGTGTSEIVIGNNVSGKGNNTGYIYPPGGGNMYQASNLTTWSQVSDRRIKKNIVDNNDGLNKINAIRVRNFEYRTEEEITDFENTKAVVVKKEGLQLGVIAQEIQEILPDVVTEESTGSLTVTPDNLTWYLINAVQELSAEIEKLKGN